VATFLAIATTLLTTGLVVVVLDTVLDIDNPFGGQWSIAPSRFQDVTERLTEIADASKSQRLPLNWISPAAK
jgi:hypothetical protein